MLLGIGFPSNRTTAQLLHLIGKLPSVVCLIVNDTLHPAHDNELFALLFANAV
jgi:hypothetical protein